jgi:acyl-coenzyme A synthetase/AMP-(fatty) acid ligase
VVVTEEVARAPNEFVRLLAAERVTVLNQTPSALAQVMMANEFANVELAVRLVILGGEALQPRVLLRWFDRYDEGRCQVANLYGITETTVHSTWKTITRVHALRDDRSIGVALPGWNAHVLDADGRRCPPGVPGEIWIGGGGLARGYLGRPGLTATRFRPAPADGLRGERLYRSGDRGRLRWDGELEYLGRLDHQVKVRGYRIELGEIRARLLEDPRVQDAAVVVARRGEASDAFIDAYVVGPEADVADLRRRLVQALPAYMVPATFSRLPTLPLTINGKVDQRRLTPEPMSALADLVEQRRNANAPVGVALEKASLERKVSDIWRHVLGIDVGPDDNFFLVGGNSLLAIRVTKRMQEQDIAHATPRHLYANPTVRGLCAALQGGR